MVNIARDFQNSANSFTDKFFWSNLARYRRHQIFKRSAKMRLQRIQGRESRAETRSLYYRAIHVSCLSRLCSKKCKRCIIDWARLQVHFLFNQSLLSKVNVTFQNLKHWKNKNLDNLCLSSVSFSQDFQTWKNKRTKFSQFSKISQSKDLDTWATFDFRNVNRIEPDQKGDGTCYKISSKKIRIVIYFYSIQFELEKSWKYCWNVYFHKPMFWKLLHFQFRSFKIQFAIIYPDLREFSMEIRARDGRTDEKRPTMKW